MLLCGEPVVDGEAQTRGSSPLWVSTVVRGPGARFLPEQSICCGAIIRRPPYHGCERTFGLGQAVDDLPELIRDRLGRRRRQVIDAPGQRRAAVLLPLYRDGGETYVLFT